MTTTTAPISREDFLAERRTGIGGSDVAALFSVGYGCERELWYDKRGVEPDYGFQETGPIELGRYLEPYIAERYARKTGRIVETRGLLRHPEQPELIVHVDRIIRAQERPEPGVLEIKALGRAMFAKVKREGILEDYVLQVQQGMLVAGMPWGGFAVMNRDDGELLHWDVERDEDICQSIREQAPLFWAKVENGPAPDMLDPEDRRCQKCQYRRQCQGAALMELAEKQTTDGEYDESLRPLLAEFDERKALAEEAADLLEETREVIRTAMGDRGLVLLKGSDPKKPRKIHFKANTVRRWDDDALSDAWANAAGSVDYDGTFLPRGGADTLFKRASEQRPLRIY